MTVFLLILHGLMAVALLGALTHQTIALMRRAAVGKSTFLDRYMSVGQPGFTRAVVVLYVLSLALGAIIYPTYRLDVRIPFEEMGLLWAIGMFEIKEHLGGVGLGILPLYAVLWRAENFSTHGRARIVVTSLLAGIVWLDFIVGHVLNNIRGVGT